MMSSQTASGWSSQNTHMAGSSATPSGTGSNFRPMAGDTGPLMAINEDGSKSKEKGKKKAVELPGYSRSVIVSKTMYSPMSFKARGESCHKREARPKKPKEREPGTGTAWFREDKQKRQAAARGEPRDCTAWVSENRQYSPYTVFDNKDVQPSPKPRKPREPPQLWLPKDPIPAVVRLASMATDNMPLGAEAGEDGAERHPPPLPPGATLKDRPSWDAEHHIMESRMNHEIQSLTREYFDKPKKKEGVGVPKVLEQYTTCDRQCSWKDIPAPFGESRYTVWDSAIEPRANQLPSYWRKIGAWDSFSAPNLHDLSIAKKGRPKEKLVEKVHTGKGKKDMLKAVADLPADQAKEFWRGWMEKQTSEDAMPPPNRWDQPQGWNDRWQIGPGNFNQQFNPHAREYFAVPRGALGSSMDLGKKTSSPKAFRRTAAESERC